MNNAELYEACSSIAIELQHLAEVATCFELAQWTYDALHTRGFHPTVAGSKGHSFVIVGDYIVDLWEKRSLKAKVWKIGEVPKDQEPEAYLDPFGNEEW